MLRMLLPLLILTGCQASYPLMQVPEQHSRIGQDLPDLGITIETSESTELQLMKLAKDESILVYQTGAIVTVNRDHEQGTFQIIIRRMLFAKTIADYLLSPPARDSLSMIPEKCESEILSEKKNMIIHTIRKCSFNGFVPVYGIELPTHFLDINVEDNGQGLSRKEIEDFLRLIQPVP